MGLLANLPIAPAPAMGLNAFFAFVVVAGMGYPGRSAWAPSSGALGLLDPDPAAGTLLAHRQHSL